MDQPGAAVVTRLAAWSAPLLVLVLLTAGVELRWQWLVEADRMAARAADGSALPDVWRVLTWSGAGPVLSVVGAAAALALVWRRCWAAAIAVLASMVALSVCWALLRLVVSRPRPPGGLVEVATAIGFPSGHAANSAGAAAVAVCLLAPVLHRRGRALLILVAVLFAAVVGVSRVVLGVHYASDVLAGWALGAVVAGAVFVTVRARTSPTRSSRRERGG